MATISSGRMEPIVFLLAPPISRLFFSPSFPLLPTFCSSSVLRRSWSRSSPFLRRDPVDWSGGRPQLWRRVEENTPRIKTGCIHDCMLHSSADPRGDRTFAPYVSARKRKLRSAKTRYKSVIHEDHFRYRFIHITFESWKWIYLSHFCIRFFSERTRESDCVWILSKGPDYGYR